MRLVLVAALIACGVLLAPTAFVRAAPGECPPLCDSIPAAAWPAPQDIPLDDIYHWPGLAGLAVTARGPRFRFETECASLPVAGDARDYAVGARAVVPQAQPQWQLQAQVLHWRGEAWRGGETALSVLATAADRLRSCQLTAPQVSPSLTTDLTDRIAAVVSLPDHGVLHEYLLAQPSSGTLTELALWAGPAPPVGWPVVPDATVLDALAAPLCVGYLDSCP